MKASARFESGRRHQGGDMWSVPALHRFKEEVMDEGTFTSTGLDLLASKPATGHVSLQWVPEPEPSRWQRFLAWLGLSDA